MNTQNITAEIASNALATLAAALEAGNSTALTTYLTITARFTTIPGRTSCSSPCSGRMQLMLQGFAHGSGLAGMFAKERKVSRFLRRLSPSAKQRRVSSRRTAASPNLRTALRIGRGLPRRLQMR
jgi:hypothetical protein